MIGAGWQRVTVVTIYNAGYGNGGIFQQTEQNTSQPMWQIWPLREIQMK